MRCLPLYAVFSLCSVAFAAPLNVLFIAVDDLRPELGCYGADHMHTPHLDRLARQGMIFDRAYCQVAVCNPSRSSVLSGSRPDSTGIFDNQHFLRSQMPDVVTLPQHFKNHGYLSLSLGKVFHHSEREPGDDPLSWSEPAWYHGEPYRHWFAQESLDLVKHLKSLPNEQRPRLIRAAPVEAADESDDVYPDGQLALQAIATLQRLKTEGKPFFLAMGFVKPHLPFTCPQKYWDLYPADSIQLPQDSARPAMSPQQAFHNNYELRSYGTVPAEGEITTAMALQLIRGYRACISFMDAQLGRVLEALDRLALRDQTIIVLWGDHGYHLGEQSVWTKMTNFEHGTRVPLLVSVPNLKTAGQRSTALVELVDLYPTLADLCGLPLPSHLEGTSFKPLLDDPDRAWKKAAFSDYVRTGKPPYRGRSIRTAEWRYTEWSDLKGKLVAQELYDQTEARNLADEPAYQTQITGLKQQLHAGWRAAQP
jgi:iduronate 2-sulfatase